MEFKDILKEYNKKIGNTSGSSHALQDLQEKQAWETRSKTNDFRSKFLCMLEASESTRMRTEESLPNYHEDHIAGKGTIHCNIAIWYTNLFLCLKQWKYPQQKRWIKNGKNRKRFRRGTKQKSETYLTRLLKQKKVEKYTSVHWWTSVIWRMPNWRQSTKIQWSSCTPRRHRVALDWLFDRIILTKRKFHTWWMEPSFVFVQHQPFQFH